MFFELTGQSTANLFHGPGAKGLESASERSRNPKNLFAERFATTRSPVAQNVGLTFRRKHGSDLVGKTAPKVVVVKEHGEQAAGLSESTHRNRSQERR